MPRLVLCQVDVEEDGVNMRWFLYDVDHVWDELNCYRCANGANNTDKIRDG